MSKTAVTNDVSGSVWQVLVAIGDAVTEGQELFLIESMKMEIPVVAPRAGSIVEILVQESHAVTADQILAWIE